ncbi:ATP-dependent helicase [Spiractinospora alimapuensis]|uniref:ATP-dependent helicase n=1 Tax=Spiractinospora alimapuensis TaxID=2820884 RepID=UPI001F3547B3|nr:ATP-dependent DNA helicase [Spiractinospora alimapuensis]QVQ54812.1 ATP-dependent helicase [Spiractinospora alimapuensis]
MAPGAVGLTPVPDQTWTPGQLARLLGRPEPTTEQAAVIAAPLSPCVVVAGAGSGKSETMAARVVWLVANGYVRPERVLGLTFTRKAANELADRVRDRLDALREADAVPTEVLDGEPTVSTYHSFATQIVGDHALREGVEPSVRLITEAVSWQLARTVVGEFDGEMDAVTNGPADVTKAVLELSGEISEHLSDPNDVREVGNWLRTRAAALKKQTKPVRDMLDRQARREQLLPLVERYRTAKAAREVLDHGDQITLAARIAARHPEVGLSERDRFHVVLLDEYQDTSHAQLVLLRSLFGDGHPVTAVGDPCQSIYGWRGASAGNLVSFPTDFPVRPGTPAPVRQLATSFRNGERILDVATVASDPLRADIAGEGEDDSGTGVVPILHPGPDRRGKGTIACGLFETDLEEADWIGDQVRSALDASTASPEEPLLTPGDVAVLCRKRSLFPVLRGALERRGIPVEVVGLGGLLTVPEVRDVVSTLRILHDPTAGNELVRLLTGRRWRLGPRDLVALGARAKELAESGRRDLTTEAPEQEVSGDLLRQTLLDLTAERGSLLDALHDPGPPERYSARGLERIGQLAAELRGLTGFGGHALTELISEVERLHGLDIEVPARPGVAPTVARADLDAFADAAARFSGSSEDPGLGAFLAYLSSAEDNEHGLEGGRVGTSDTVKLMTVHGAKGLQWSMVIVPGLCGGASAPVFPAKPVRTSNWLKNERRLPFPLRGDRAALPTLEDVDPAAIADLDAANVARERLEERRLFYVALTRAADTLLCTGHWWGEAQRTRGPSEFLEEVRAACAGGAGRVARWAAPPEEDERNPRLGDPVPVPWPAPDTPLEHAAPALDDLDGGPDMEFEEPSSQPEEEGVEPESDPVTGAAASYHASVAAARLLAESRDGVGERWLEQLSDAHHLPEWQRRRAEAWQRDTDLLLAHRDRTEPQNSTGADVVLPRRVSVSALVGLRRDPAALAREIRRPMPHPPTPHTRRGTSFHAWLEGRFGQGALLGPDELPGAADDALAPDEDFDRLRENFESGEWAERTPVAVEVAFETPIAGHLVRGRIDAVFADGDRYDVVDWKTGRPPATQEERDAAAVQLAAYRAAWAELADVPLDRVGAAFYFVRTQQTIRPADLLTPEALAALLDDLPPP